MSNHCCRGEAVSIAYFGCVFVALVFQSVPYYTVICDLPACTKFSTLSHNRYGFQGAGKLLNTKCVFWFSLQLLSETFLILRKTEGNMVKNVYWSSCKVPVIWYSAADFRKILKYQISWKSVQWEPGCSMWTDGQTWRSYYPLVVILRMALKWHSSNHIFIRSTQNYHPQILQYLGTVPLFLDI